MRSPTTGSSPNTIWSSRPGRRKTCCDCPNAWKRTKRPSSSDFPPRGIETHKATRDPGVSSGTQDGPSGIVELPHVEPLGQHGGMPGLQIEGGIKEYTRCRRCGPRDIAKLF